MNAKTLEWKTVPDCDDPNEHFYDLFGSVVGATVLPIEFGYRLQVVSHHGEQILTEVKIGPCDLPTAQAQAIDLVMDVLIDDLKAFSKARAT